MSRVVFDGKYRVFLCDELTNRDAPTVTELTAGDDITALCPKDFLNLGTQQGRVDGGDISTLFGAESMGTWKMQASSQHFLDDEDAENVAWNTMDLNVLKDVVVLPYAGTAGPADGDAAYVFPVEFGKHTPTNPGENQRQRMTIDWALYEEPHLDAVVVGSS